MQKEIYHIRDYMRTALPLAIWDEPHILTKNMRHKHDCIEIMFVYRGAGSCGIDEMRYPLRAGSMYVILEGESHNYTCDPGMHFYNIMFTRKLFRTAEEKRLYTSFLRTFETVKVITFNTAAMKFMLELLRRMNRELEVNDPLSEFGIRILFMEFLFYVLRRTKLYVPESPLNRQEMLISRLYDYVEKHYREKITLEKAARGTGITAEYLGRLFKNAAGIDFSSYVSHFRMEKSIEALEETDKTISEIAFENGFYDTAYYIHMFRRLYGTTPGKYRKGAFRN